MKLTEYKLDELYKIDSGINTTKEQAGHGNPFLSFSTIFNNPILPEELPDKMDTSVEEQDKYSILKGDVFFTRTSETLNELAMSGVAIKDYPGSTFSGFAKRLRPIQNDKTYDKFMAYYFRSAYFRKIIDYKAVMTLRASFNEDIFSYIKVILPDYDHQVKAGDLFYNIECKIRNNNKIIEKIDKLTKLTYQYWFLQFEFPGKSGKSYRKNTGKMCWDSTLKRNIPVHWKAGKLSELIESIKTGLNPRDNFTFQKDGNINYITVKNLSSNGNIDFNKCDKITQTEKDIIHKRSDISIGDILFASIAPLGRCYLIIDQPEDYDINESVFSIRPNKKTVSSEFLYLLFTDSSFINSITNKSTGSIFDGIRIKTLLDVDILIPNKEVIDCFTDNVKKIFMFKNKLINENQKLTELRNYLLPLLMTGQIIFK